MQKRSAAAVIESDTTAPKSGGRRKKLGQGPVEEAGDAQGSSPDDLWSDRSLEASGLGDLVKSGRPPASGVPGISEGEIVLTYIFQMSDKGFEKLVTQHERRTAKNWARRNRQKIGD